MGSIDIEPDVSETYDIVAVGAGISGINTAYRLQTKLPNAKFTILEGRNEIGGTWSLFKYPGLRSDSDLHTFGFPWEPWPYDNPIAEAPLILDYMKKCIAKYNLDRHIQFGHKVVSADWSSKARRWTVVISLGGGEQVKRISTKFLMLGTGYYDYKTPLQTTIPGLERFKGQILHPQFWPEDYDYNNKRIAIIGSGATAVTIFPVLAKTAALVTLIQRSPTYIVSKDNTSQLPWLLRVLLPRWIQATLQRWSNILFPHLFVMFCEKFPLAARNMIRKETVRQLPPHVPQDPHFKPSYRPWAQRLCLAPDGDFYTALHRDNAGIRTGTIETVTEEGILMKGQDEKPVPYDAIVTATGLKMRFAGGIQLTLDGSPPVGEWEKRLIWNGSMVSGLPNFMFVWGYTNASWTLGSDDTAIIMIRLLRYMEARGKEVAVPVVEGSKQEGKETTRMWQLSSTYSDVAEGWLPRYGVVGPWRSRTNPPLDYLHARYGNVTNDLEFS